MRKLFLLLLLLIFAASFLAAFHTSTQSRPANPAAEAIRKNNLGAAYMNQQRMEQALEQFRDARSLNPKLSVALLNEGIALLNLQRADAARKVLLEAVEKLPENPRVWYNLGLLYKSAGETDAAIEAFARAAKLTPADADVHYFLGTLHAQAQHYDDAIAAYERALQLNRFHASAEFGLSRAWQRKGNADESRKHMARFQHISQERLGAPMSLAYGDQGTLSLAEEVAPRRPSAAAAIPVKFVPIPENISGLKLSWLDPKKRADYEGMARVAPKYALLPFAKSHCLLDYDNDGDLDLFVGIQNPDEVGARLFERGPTQYTDVTVQAGFASISSALPFTDTCAAGDYDNDGWTDLAIETSQGLLVYRNRRNRKFADVTSSIGLPDGLSASGITWVDLDHDGDLDLYVSRLVPESGARDSYWRNNGNGSFTDWTEQTGLLDGAGWSGKVVASDVNNDRATDLVKASDRSPAHFPVGRRPLSVRPSIYLNPREGKFVRADSLTASMTPDQKQIRALDFNNDGWMDLALGHYEGGVTLWRNVNGTRFEQVALPAPTGRFVLSLVVLDYDNDGWQDLAFTDMPELKFDDLPKAPRPADDRLNILRNVGGSKFVIQTKEVSPRPFKHGPDSLSAADVDSDGDADLVLSGINLDILRNVGGNRNNWLKLSLRGLADNKSAIGTKVEVFAGASYQKFEINSPNDLLVGLGHEKQADIVRLLWPTGVLQDEIGLAANQRHVITELDRRGSSCPILFAWNGSRFEFIADMIGPGIVGHWVAPGVRNTPDPTEYLKVPGSSVRPRDGKLHFRFLEPMEEVVYLDQVRLSAVDHPANSEVFPNERFAASPPLPEFKVIVSRNARPPAGAWDDRDRNILPDLLHRDRRYITGFDDAPYKGFAKTHSIELDLGNSVEASPDVPLRLLMHGFTDYFTATSVYAAHQAGVTAIVPRVDALLPNGHWTRVSDDIGFPAGLARTMVADLTGKLPKGTRRIRITTNLKVYWDQVLIDTTEDAAQINGRPNSFRLIEVPLDSARLRFLGYPRELHGTPKSDLRYVYEEVSATGPYARHAGNYTRYGDVTPLVGQVDDRFAILGSGDEVAVAFDAQSLPSLPPGWKRDYFFFASGYAKDMDFYAANGYTVDPLPFGSMPRYPYAVEDGKKLGEQFLDYLLDFNSRPVSGNVPRSFRYEYRPRK